VTPLLVALGAAVGAPLRYLVASRLDRDRFPVGTLAVNVLGSFLLGLFVAAGVNGHGLALLGTGFCGGFTTYSAFAVQTHRLPVVRGATYAVTTVAVSLAACAFGALLGQP
jgi:CrcB protein